LALLLQANPVKREVAAAAEILDEDRRPDHQHVQPNQSHPAVCENTANALVNALILHEGCRHSGSAICISQKQHC
jgi:hypothetical protein